VARLDEIPGISLAAAHVILAAVLGNAGAAKTGIFPGERYRRISRRRGSKRRKRGHTRQIEALGCKVTLQPAHRRTHRSMGTPRCRPGRCSSVIPAEVINSGRVPHRPGGQLMLLEQDHVGPAQMREVIGKAVAGHPAADDHHVCAARHHPPMVPGSIVVSATPKQWKSPAK
jgi:hypothetical protein